MIDAEVVQVPGSAASPAPVLVCLDHGAATFELCCELGAMWTVTLLLTDPRPSQLRAAGAAVLGSTAARATAAAWALSERPLPMVVVSSAAEAVLARGRRSRPAAAAEGTGVADEACAVTAQIVGALRALGIRPRWR